ncbi:MAG: hypothetical protein EA376_03785 [Phycisphaeraceae bacterium]|nr:MAG: hypothetical protein EA376_03785 [Phycisphaeraceae bacterium]
MQFWTVEEIESDAMADHCAGEEIAPGVTIERRTILRVGLVAAAAAVAAPAALLTGCVSGRSTSGAKQAGVGAAGERMRTMELIAALRPRARELIGADHPDEESYVAAAARLLSRLEPDQPWQMREVGETGWSMNTAAYFPPIVLFDIRMRPGSRIHLHDHRHYNGVLLCTEGETRCRNFDIVQKDGKQLDIAAGEVPAQDEDFFIRQTRDDILKRERSSTLTRDRDNIHHIEAGPDGCALTDFFTHFRPGARSYEIDWDEKPIDKREGVYRVSWRT